MKPIEQKTSSAAKGPLLPAISFDYLPEAIEKNCQKLQTDLVAALNRIGATPNNQVTLENSLLALELELARFSNRINPLLFLKQVSTDPLVRAASDRAEMAVCQLFVDIYVREDLFGVLKALKEGNQKLSPLETRLLDEYLVAFRRNGLELPPEKRAIFIEKKKALVLLESEFSKALGEWKDALEVSEAELEGLPKDFIQGLEKTSEGKYKIKLDYPSYNAFMENARSPDARQQLEFKFNNRGGEANVRLMERALVLRNELAQLLGYKTHAEFVLERRMAKKPEAVVEFLERLGKKLKAKGKEDLDELLALKREVENNPHETDFPSWDWRFYSNLLRKKKYQVDNERIKEYFPLKVVLAGMFEIYQKLLSVVFVPVEGGPVWNPSAQLFRVERDGKTAAFFYMDLFPREGKYGHAAAFTLHSGFEDPAHQYQIPVSAIVANFTPPVGDNPSLLEHTEVETLFHEFGHIMHQVLTRAKHATFSGTSVKTDFVEAPSQMLENWVWEKDSLSKISGHYRDPSKPLPDADADRLLKAKLMNVGLKYLRQVAFATIDMHYHTQTGVDSTKVYSDKMREIMLIPIQSGTHPQASFGHLMGGYDSGYYGYLWSEVFAQDMFTRFETEGLLSEKAGADYRHWILEPGGEKEPFELLRGFLGREPNEKAFLRSIGLKA